ncbi:alpha/beta hydrolase, partial [Thermodesulfobacteriota bacterium]
CNPERIKRLVLVDARPGPNPEASDALKQLIATLPLETESITNVVEVILEIYPYISHDLCLHIARHGYRKRKDGPYVPRYDARMSYDIEHAGYVAEDLWGFLKSVPCKTLVIRGEESPFLTAKDADRMCEMMPEAVCREIPKATHMPAQENPEAFLRVVSGFLGLV